MLGWGCDEGWIYGRCHRWVGVMIRREGACPSIGGRMGTFKVLYGEIGTGLGRADIRGNNGALKWAMEA